MKLNLTSILGRARRRERPRIENLTRDINGGNHL